MMSSIDALLNHEGATTTATMPTTTTYEAADALTTLATLGSGQQYASATAIAPTRELPSPTAAASTHTPRRSSSFDGTSHTSHDHRAAPVEPSPPLDSPVVHSPTLDHYHHAARSPAELQRRESLRGEAVVLAPIMDTTKDSAARDAQDQDIEHAGTTSTQDTTQDTQDTQHVSPDSHIDPDTLKAIEAAKTDLGLRTKRPASVTPSVTPSVAPSIASPTDAKPAPSKKRPAPSSASSANPTVKKKGTAKTKPSKKRKLDDDGRSLTPSSSRKKRSHAGTPLQSSPAPDDDDHDSSSEDHNLYCICKKPDNHKWMIGCDGGCDDWFHGDCVNMKQADECLVDKFICPLCEESGKGNTTWKPMCRRDGCRRPARPAKDQASKYCSDECGVLFMQEQLHRTAGAKAKDKPKKKKKTDDADDEPTPLGGVLRAKDLKALVDASPNIQAFKNLGCGVLSPPYTASPTRSSFTASPDDVALTAAETERLTALHNEKSQLNDRLEVLKDREKFVSMAKEQATRVADREKLKLKEFCGYDARLSWSDAEFLLWRNAPHGRAAFHFSTLSPSAEQLASLNPDAPTTPTTETVCLKKRCPKHPQWQKLNLQDARFEELEVVEAIRECEKEERSVRERARRRNAKDVMAKELVAAEGQGCGEVRNRDGWVEVVAS